MIDETVEEIEEMQTHSSSVVAIKATEALRELLDREYATVEEFERGLERNAKALQRANQSHASLHNAMRGVVDSVSRAEPETVDDAKAALSEAIESVVDDVEHGKRRAAENAKSLVEDGTTILTHDYSSTVLEAIELATRDGAYIDVFVTEARPRYLGRKTARTLAGNDRVETHLLTDSGAGYYMDECDRVLIGMDCIVEDTLYNRVGTFPIAATAAQCDVPVTVVGSGAKVIEDGFIFENEFRSPSEVMREPAEGFDVRNPAYDATPVSLLESVVTDNGEKEF
ncbi:translation initiation factor eIF-2B [Haloarchaeobius sp. HME9146]|uniref:translation initiation factor eIF-2B n=1 Tax=Haloarchaeobius sp. HME9146 TaxID=2978732 RepID=UPI0021BFEDE3|nr:translation initiation factor eIF-2B [Haloarchaeobius sp. HME9146]MCT9097143.1 translation initiation factor eIF-2B [Haloarchaeobius sp. HME9146]